MHYIKEIKYLNRIADYFQSQGYEVESPSIRHRDLLDVWGYNGKRKCFTEIYVTIYECNNGINGIWTCDDESVEVFLNCNDNLIGESGLISILGTLKPCKN